jgi:hypothetical protein
MARQKQIVRFVEEANRRIYRVWGLNSPETSTLALCKLTFSEGFRLVIFNNLRCGASPSVKVNVRIR